jgi:putative ABC transport system substrate-binding protein
LPSLAADLVRRQVAVLVATGPAAVPAKAATSTIPIVFSTAADPVANGLVASLNRPGGNITGVTTLGNELGPKRLELLHELVPRATNVALLLDPTISGAMSISRDLEAAASTLGLQAHIFRASNDLEINKIFESFVELRVDALAIVSSQSFNTRSERLGRLALLRAVPAIFQNREFAAAGGLMSYGSNVTDSYHLAGSYTGRILKGEKPADLPVQQATTVELFINGKTAKVLDLNIPLALLGRADEVIE